MAVVRRNEGEGALVVFVAKAGGCDGGAWSHMSELKTLNEASVGPIKEDGIHIERIQIEEGFLNGLDVWPLPGLAVMIGARGTGKTSLVELIRFCLDVPGYTPESNRRSRDHALSGFCRKLLERLRKQLSLDIAMLRERRIAEMRIGHLLGIGACGSYAPLRCHPALLTPTERI